jgi:hypothetical protein
MRRAARRSRRSGGSAREPERAFSVNCRHSSRIPAAGPWSTDRGPAPLHDVEQDLRNPSEQSVELLKELHILTRDGKLNQDSRRKLKQVYHLFQFIEPPLLASEPTRAA